jgi:hypothetical protein
MLKQDWKGNLQIQLLAANISIKLVPSPSVIWNGTIVYFTINFFWNFCSWVNPTLRRKESYVWLYTLKSRSSYRVYATNHCAITQPINNNIAQPVKLGVQLYGNLIGLNTPNYCVFLRSNIPQTALVATLDTYDFHTYDLNCALTQLC